MLPSDMNLKIKTSTVGYNNKILVSDEKFILGKNDKVNSLEAPSMKSPRTAGLEQTCAIHRDLEQKLTTSHEEEKIAFVLSLTGIFTIWYLFQ